LVVTLGIIWENVKSVRSFSPATSCTPLIIGVPFLSRRRASQRSGLSSGLLRGVTAAFGRDFLDFVDVARTLDFAGEAGCLTAGENGKDPFEQLHDAIEVWIIAAGFDELAGVSNGRPVAAELLADVGQR
jgi:hypothetical protein